MEISCTYDANEGVPYSAGTPDTVDTSANSDSFAKYMEITSMVYMDDLFTGKKYTRAAPGASWTVSATNTKWQVEDQAPTDGITSLYDLENDPIDDLTPPDSDTQLEMRLKFHQNAGNDLQGDTLDLTMRFTLNQDSSRQA